MCFSVAHDVDLVHDGPQCHTSVEGVGELRAKAELVTLVTYSLIHGVTTVGREQSVQVQSCKINSHGGRHTAGAHHRTLEKSSKGIGTEAF